MNGNDQGAGGGGHDSVGGPEDAGPGPESPGPSTGPTSGSEGVPPRVPTEQEIREKGYLDRYNRDPFDIHSKRGLDIWKTDPEFYDYIRNRQERIRDPRYEDAFSAGRMGGQSQSPYRGVEEGKGGSEIGGIFGGKSEEIGAGGTAGTKVRDIPSAESKDADSVVIGGALNINLSGPRALKTRMRITSRVSKTSDISDFSLGNKSVASSFMENLEISKFDFRVGPEDRVDMSTIGNIGFGRYFKKGA